MPETDLISFATRLRHYIARQIEAATRAAWGPQADAEFAGLAVELFALQFRNNDSYRRYCESLAVNPGLVRDWREIPAVPPAAFKEVELTSIPAGKRTTVFHSSGTTGRRPSRHFHCPESLELYDTAAWQWFRACVSVSPENPVGLAILTPAPSDAPHSSLVRMFENFRVKLRLPRAEYFGRVLPGAEWETASEQAVAWLEERARANQPALVMGTAFSFVHLLDWLQGSGVNLRLPEGTRVLETGGYKGRSRELSKPELYGLITERLGVPSESIFSEYGMSELSSQAYDILNGAETGSVGSRRVFRFPPWVRTRLVSAETGEEVREGETGLLRIFDLANVWSVMALQTEDLAVSRGDGFELAGRAWRAEPRGCSLMLAADR